MKQRCLQIATAFAFKRRGKALLILSCGNYRFDCKHRADIRGHSRLFSSESSSLARVIFTFKRKRNMISLFICSLYKNLYRYPKSSSVAITAPLSETDRRQFRRRVASVREYPKSWCCFRSACHRDAGGAFLNRRLPGRTRAGINIAESTRSSHPFVYACRVEFRFNDSRCLQYGYIDAS